MITTNKNRGENFESTITHIIAKKERMDAFNRFIPLLDNPLARAIMLQHRDRIAKNEKIEIAAFMECNSSEIDSLILNLKRYQNYEFAKLIREARDSVKKALQEDNVTEQTVDDCALLIRLFVKSYIAIHLNHHLLIVNDKDIRGEINRLITDFQKAESKNNIQDMAILLTELRRLSDRIASLFSEANVSIASDTITMNDVGMATKPLENNIIRCDGVAEAQLKKSLTDEMREKLAMAKISSLNEEGKKFNLAKVANAIIDVSRKYEDLMAVYNERRKKSFEQKKERYGPTVLAFYEKELQKNVDLMTVALRNNRKLLLAINIDPATILDMDSQFIDNLVVKNAVKIDVNNNDVAWLIPYKIMTKAETSQ